MFDPRAILLAAAALTGVAPQGATALTPLPVSFAIDPQAFQLPSANTAPGAVEQSPEELLEGVHARVTNRRARLQCVPFARRESGIELYGDASTWWRQASERYETASAPADGAVLVLHGYSSDNRGHVAVVTQVLSDRIIAVDHANWLNGGEITRDVPIMDVSEAGDWSEVRVWHVPGQYWGGRTYRVQGFILDQPAVGDGDAALIAQQPASAAAPAG